MKIKSRDEVQVMLDANRIMTAGVIIGRKMAEMDGYLRQYELEEDLSIFDKRNEGRFLGYNSEGREIAKTLLESGWLREVPREELINE